jgi:hypothetical protein
MILTHEALLRRRSKITLKIPLRVRTLFPAAALVAMIVYIGTLPASGPEPVRRIHDSPAAGGVSISVSDTFFRESRIAAVRIRAAGSPARINLYLENDKPGVPPVYSAPFPFESLDEKTTVFVLGENPPNPLDAEIVLPAQLAGVLRAEAVYDVYDPALDTEGAPQPEVSDYVLVVKVEARLSTSGIPD